MKRPYLVHFHALDNGKRIAVKMSVASRNYKYFSKRPLTAFTLPYMSSIPLSNYRLLAQREYHLLIKAYDFAHNLIYKKEYTTDLFGDCDMQLPSSQDRPVTFLQIYGYDPLRHIYFLLGTHIPLKLTPPQKIIVSDYDKTLVDTRHTTLFDMLYSLIKPLAAFPSLEASINIFKEHIERDFQPFVLSASPHFYEKAIRDWLYQKHIYTAGLFLKDYRKIFSWRDLSLSSKDIKVQGYFKLDRLLDIILLSGIPNELVLMGDNSQSDPDIYLALSSILEFHLSPHQVWRKLKEKRSFRLTNAQSSHLLNKLAALEALAHKKEKEAKVNIKIFIRMIKETEIRADEELKSLTDTTIIPYWI